VAPPDGEQVTLREHIEALRVADDVRYQQRFDSQQDALNAALLAAKEAVQTALLAAKEAVIKAEVATENRLTLLNELRSGVATKEQMDAMAERLSDIKERQDRLEGRSAGLSDGMKVLISIVGLVIALVGLYLTFHK
jgi:phosphopantetheinyl transferase (holo-ACP synthase)